MTAETAAVVTPADILNGAAALIAERGKAEGRYRDDVGRLCAIGAMREWAFGDAYAVACDHPEPAVRAAYTAARGALERRVGDHCCAAMWSDDTAADKVVAELRRTALALAKAEPDGVSE